MSGVPRVAITGGYGFLGWHTACRLRAVHGIEPIRLDREGLADPERLDADLAGVDAIIHIAGVNRADSDEAIEQGNIEIARNVAGAVSRLGRPLNVSYANSIQAKFDNPYGRGKAQSAEILDAAVADAGGRFSNVLLPNLFGEHGRPSYNSFVATFAHLVATGGQPTVNEDRTVPLLHAQVAAAALIAPVLDGPSGTFEPAGELRSVVEVLNLLESMHALYSTGEVPSLGTKFEVDLFNTYRSYLFPTGFPFEAEAHSDNRGSLYETVRSHGGTGQAFVSTTVPGSTRGDHYHLNKVERFFVVKGEARIELRRLLHDDVVTFTLSGERPAFVDMPTLWVHNITNIGGEELVTVFWADQLLDAENPDQYPERVRLIKEHA